MPDCYNCNVYWLQYILTDCRVDRNLLLGKQKQKKDRSVYYYAYQPLKIILLSYLCEALC